MPYRLHVFHALQRAHSALFRAADQFLKREVGLTATQQAVLFVLLKTDGTTISDIADTLCMGKSSLTGLIDRMAASGLVRRAHDDRDARLVRVFLLPAGQDIAQRTLVDTKAANAALLAPFNKQDQAVIARFLDHLATNAPSFFNQPQSEKDATAKRI